MNSKNYTGINLMRFIMSITVVVAHTRPYDVFGGGGGEYRWLDTIINLNVPFFLISFGFFLYERRTSLLEVLKKYLRLYAIWSIIYLPFAVYNYQRMKIGFLKSACWYLIELLFNGEHWQSWPLWYLLSVIYAIMLLLIVQKILRNRYLEVYSCIALCLFILAGWYTHFGIKGSAVCINYLSIFFGNTGRLFTAPLYLICGMIIKIGKIAYLDDHRTGVLLFLGGYVYKTLFAHTGGYYSEFSLVICAMGLFIIAKSIPIKDLFLTSYFRTASTVIYFTHMLTFTILSLLLYQEIRYGFAMFIVTVGISIIVSFVGFYLKKKNNGIFILFFNGHRK